MSKHTPGPWEWNTARTRMNDDRGRPVLMDGEGIWDLCAPVMHGDARADANAKLIAAAPELLEALKTVTAHLVAAHSLLERGGKKAAASDKMFEQMLNDYEKAFEAGRAAIAKAGG